ncbi:MAG: hypothetical protein N0C84_17030 [Candidatus Thiodiazotropha taylori]|uniref:Uncharacterized protein n=1 Tax=Candidatus Thiodiazotropha taylori TaxID=2792791 RepID=A0A9E4T422_9GAMM|nr:hypothetical protein [Candidatus Thiodiazotropha taylori]MCW4258171.1 hypothetical protein [Candidatus Thiodiazotropha taylori]
MAKLWTRQEDELIARHFQERGLQWVVDRLLNRSRAAVAKRALKLGIRGRQWTGAEDYVIRTCYKRFGAGYCRRYMPRRSEIAIMSRARRLGVLRDRKQRKKVMDGHDEIGCVQAAIKTGWMPEPDDLPEGFFELEAKDERVG